MKLFVLGGLDPTGGAGVLRDRWTAEMLVPDIEVVTVITAMTEQGDGRPARAQPVAREQLAEQLHALAEASAIKLGLVPAALVEVVIEALRGIAAPTVLDPVLRASDGGALGASAETLRELGRVVRLITPNRAEARALLGAADALLPAAVLLKDVGDDASHVCDRLVDGELVHEYVRPRRSSVDPRGTGCALATAIACALALGEPLPRACARAIDWLDRARLHTSPGPDGRPHLPRSGFGFE